MTTRGIAWTPPSSAGAAACASKRCISCGESAMAAAAASPATPAVIHIPVRIG